MKPVEIQSSVEDQSVTDEGADDTARLIARLAVGALLAEAELTPKPALVDRRGGGAHQDMDLALLRRSAQALAPTFEGLARAARGRSPDPALRESLGRIGREGERAMLAATGGRNTHRGAIWSLGLLSAAAAAAEAAPCSADVWAGAVRLTAGAADLARIPDRYRVRGESHGSRMEHRYGARGAAGEAEAGFPHVLGYGLRTLWSARARGVPEPSARLDALIAIMADLEDTCLLQRGGREALSVAQRGARAVMTAGGCASEQGRQALLRLDSDLKARWASPGGSADLLAATLFVDRWVGGEGDSPWRD